MGIRQYFNNPEEKRAFNEVERIWPDLAKWAETAVISRSNKAALDRMRTDAVLRRMYRAASAKFFRFDKFILRVVPGMRLEANKTVAEPADFADPSVWSCLQSNGIWRASESLIFSGKTQPATLANALNHSGIKTLIVDVPLDVKDATGLSDALRPITLVFCGSGRLRCWCSLIISSPIVAGPTRVFETYKYGEITFKRHEGMAEIAPLVYPEWWGASPQASAAVNARSIQQAIDSVYQEGVVALQAGTYPINTALRFQGNSSVVLQGQGPDSTILLWTGSLPPAVEKTAPPPSCILIRNSSTLRSLGLRGSSGVSSSDPKHYDPFAKHACGIVHLDSSPSYQNLSIEGFPVGILIHHTTLDRPKPSKHDAPDPNETNKTSINRIGLRGIDLRNVDWGIVFDCGTNGSALKSVTIHHAWEGVVIPDVRYIDNEPLVQPPAAMVIQSCTFEDVVVGIHAQGGMAGPLVEGCRFVRCTGHAILFGADTIRSQPAFIGRNEYIDCNAEVTASVSTGLSPVPWLHVSRPEGTSAGPPVGTDWRDGDRVYNRIEEASLGSPMGWVRLQTSVPPVQDMKYAGKVHYDVVVDTSPANRSVHDATTTQAKVVKKR